MSKRIRFNRADINSAVEAAKKLKASREVYIVRTAYGYSIMAAKPPAWQNYIVVKPDGSTEIVRYAEKSNTVSSLDRDLNAGDGTRRGMLPCPKCQTPNPLPPRSLFVKCRKCGARLIKIKIIKNQLRCHKTAPMSK